MTQMLVPAGTGGVLHWSKTNQKESKGERVYERSYSHSHFFRKMKRIIRDPRGDFF